MHKVLLPGLLMALVLMQGCKLPLSPDIKGVSNFKLNRDNPDHKLRLQLAMEVFNPNKYQIKLKSHELKVFLNGVLIGEVCDKKTQKMKGYSTTSVRFALQTDLKKVLGGIAVLAGGLIGGKNGVDLRINGKLRVRAKGIGKSLPVDYSTTVDLAELL